VRVLVRLATPLLAPFIRALTHRRTSAGDVSLTVCVGSGAAPAPLPSVTSAGAWWSRGRPGAGGPEDDGDREIRALHVGTTGALSVLDVHRRRAVFWAPDPAAVASSDGGAPLLHLLTWWLGRHGRYPVHAGAVGTPAGGVLLIGKGGAGKSTTALACLDSTLLHAGDDYVLLSETPTPFVHGLYQSAKLHADQLWRLPRVAAGASAGDPGKVLLFLDRRYPHKLTSGFALRAVLMPRVTGLSDTRLVPATAVQTLDALIPSSVVELPGLGRDAVRAIVRIVRSVPSYVLEAGTDLTQIPPVIARLLDGR
jgi:hypothetical protein